VNFYFATCSVYDITPIKNLRYKNVLSSFFYYKKGNFREYYLKNRHWYDNFFMDSGAFSFDNLGVKIDIDEYINCIKKDEIKHYSVLDVIGDPKATRENYLYMKSKDLDPVPCFHINTDIDYLDFYLEECDKLAIGGMVQAQNIHHNLKKIWSKILNQDRKIQVHGFGVSNPSLAVSYPWHSIDSSSYCAITKFARASEWKIDRFVSFDTFDLLDKWKICTPKQEEKGKTVGGLECFLLYWQMEQYNQMIDYVNEKQKNMDFNFLTAQMSMF
jgi:hypothetical protein